MRVILLSTFAAVTIALAAPASAGDRPNSDGCYESYPLWPFSDLKGEYCPVGVRERASEPHTPNIDPPRPERDPEPEPNCPRPE